MCFTVNVNIVKEELEKRFNTTFIDHDNYRPSYYYHAHSLPELPVVANFDDDFSIRLLKWGLIPAWTRGEEEAKEIRFMTFNARAETIKTRPSFSGSYKSRRCMIPVRGFFEWQHKAGMKIPWYIYLPDSEIMMLAGLYDSWKDSITGKQLNTFTIITSRANKLLEEIHNTKKRMPVILGEEEKDTWLSASSSEAELDEVLEPFPDESIDAHTIGPLIGNQAANRNKPELILPYDYPEQSSLFPLL